MLTVPPTHSPTLPLSGERRGCTPTHKRHKTVTRYFPDSGGGGSAARPTLNASNRCNLDSLFLWTLPIPWSLAASTWVPHALQYELSHALPHALPHSYFERWTKSSMHGHGLPPRHGLDQPVLATTFEELLAGSSRLSEPYTTSSRYTNHGRIPKQKQSASFISASIGLRSHLTGSTPIGPAPPVKRVHALGIS